MRFGVELNWVVSCEVEYCANVDITMQKMKTERRYQENFEVSYLCSARSRNYGMQLDASHGTHLRLPWTTPTTHSRTPLPTLFRSLIQFGPSLSSQNLNFVAA